MEQNLTDEQVERIVQIQLKRLEDDYQLTKSFDILSKNQALPQQIVVQNKEKQENNNLSDESENAEEQDNPYQLMGDDGDQDNAMFSDEDEQQVQNNNEKKQQQENIQYNVDQQVRIKEDIYKPQQSPIDTAKIVQIAQKMNIQTPNWAVQPTQFEKRIRELFGNSVSK